jgi:hypothetical protein
VASPPGAVGALPKPNIQEVRSDTVKLRPLVAGAAGVTLLLPLTERPAGADDSVRHARTVTVAGHTCKLTFALEVSEGSGGIEDPDRVWASTASYYPENIYGDIDPYCAEAVEVVARVEYDSAGVHSNYVNRRTGPNDPKYPDTISVDVTGESRYNFSADTDDGFHNGVASYKVIFPNGVYFTDSIDFSSSK